MNYLQISLFVAVVGLATWLDPFSLFFDCFGIPPAGIRGIQGRRARGFQFSLKRHLVLFV